MQLRCNPSNPQRVIGVILDKKSRLSCIDMYWFDIGLITIYGILFRKYLMIGGVPAYL